MMLLRKRDLADTPYRPAKGLDTLPKSADFMSHGSKWTFVVTGPKFDSKENLKARLHTAIPPSAEVVRAARAALERIEARGKFVPEDWAAALAKDLGRQVD